MEPVVLLIADRAILVDGEDVDRISSHHWTPYGRGRSYLSTAVDGDDPPLHQFILGVRLRRGDSYVVDHINQDTNDNRKENLRIVTPSQNRMNVGLYRNNKTGIRGVWFNPKKGRYVAYLTFNRQRKTIGYFHTVDGAAAARERYESSLAIFN